MQDYLNALITFVKADGPVAAIASTRVYGIELPESIANGDAQDCITITPAGGIETARTDRLVKARLDVRSYSDTPFNAMTLDRALWDALEALQRSANNSTLMHAVWMAGSPFALKDPDIHWPFMLRPITLVVSGQST